MLRVCDCVVAVVGVSGGVVVAGSAIYLVAVLAVDDVVDVVVLDVIVIVAGVVGGVVGGVWCWCCWRHRCSCCCRR